MGITSVGKAEPSEPLFHRLEELERRVSRLEVLGVGDPNQVTTERTPSESAPAAVPAKLIDAGGIGHLFGNVAIALIGIAGGYLLRTAVEVGWLNHSTGIISAFLYALMWIVAGGFTKRGQAAAAIYALASSIMFAGALWENTVRSPALSPSTTALLIGAYLLDGYLTAWFRNRGEIAAVTAGSLVALSLTLFLTTHNLIPFDISLLCAAAASEFAASRGRWLEQRWIAALGADFAVFITVWIFNSAALPDGYAPFGGSTVLAIQVALAFLYLASMGYRTLAAGATATAFEIGQSAVAISAFILGQFVMAPAGSHRLLTGIVCFLLAKGGYAASILLGRKKDQRSSAAYAFFGFVLQTTAILVVVPVFARVFALCALGIAAAALGNRQRQMSLQLQAPAYLFAAALGSGLAGISSQPLSSLIVPRAGQLIAMLVTAVAATLAYRLGGSGQAEARIPALLCAAVLVWSGLGLGAIAIKAIFGSFSLATSLRIALICSAAIGLARWGRFSGPIVGSPGWIWISYPLMLWAAWRILVEDLASGRPASAAILLTCYGGTLLLLSRILRSRKAELNSR